MDFYLIDSKGHQSNVEPIDFRIEGGFGYPINYPNSIDYLYLGDTAIGDLNGDGRNDVVAIQGSNYTNLILIYYQNSSGGLNNAISMSPDIAPRSIAIADVNNDGNDDLIITGQYINDMNIEVMLQHPDSGELESPQKYALNSSLPGRVAIDDLNEDGLNDIVVVVDSGIKIIFQDSNGIFSSEVDLDVPHTILGEIHIADMNNDGKNDIVIQSGNLEVAVVKQISLGTFSTTPDFYTVQTINGSNLSDFAVGDLNGDNLKDIVTVGNSSFINIFLQNSQGTLNDPTLITGSAVCVEIADMTGDGLNDIITNGTLYPQMSDHTYLSSENKAGPGGEVYTTQALSIGDVTGDGHFDAVVGSYYGDGLYVNPYAKLLIL